MFPYLQVPRVEKKVFGKDNKDNNHNSLHLTLKNCPNICPWALSVPRGSQDSSNFTLGELFKSPRKKNATIFSHQMEATELCIQKTRTYAQQQTKNFYPGHLGEGSLQSYLFSILRLWT